MTLASSSPAPGAASSVDVSKPVPVPAPSLGLGRAVQQRATRVGEHVPRASAATPSPPAPAAGDPVWPLAIRPADALAPVLARSVALRAGRIQGPLLQRNGEDETDPASYVALGLGAVSALLWIGWYLWPRSPTATTQEAKQPAAKKPARKEPSTKELIRQAHADQQRALKARVSPEEGEATDAKLAEIAAVLADDWAVQEGPTGHRELSQISQMTKELSEQRRAVALLGATIPPERSRGYDAKLLSQAHRAHSAIESDIADVAKLLGELSDARVRDEIDRALQEREFMFKELRRVSGAWKTSRSNRAAAEVSKLHSDVTGGSWRLVKQDHSWTWLKTNVAARMQQLLNVRDYLDANPDAINVPVHESTSAKKDARPTAATPKVIARPSARTGPPPVVVDRATLKPLIMQRSGYVAGETAVAQCLTGIEDGDGKATGTRHEGREVQHISHGVPARGDGCTLFYDVNGGALTLLGVGQHQVGYRARYRLAWKDDTWAEANAGKFVNNSPWVIDLTL